MAMNRNSGLLFHTESVRNSLAPQSGSMAPRGGPQKGEGMEGEMKFEIGVDLQVNLESILHTQLLEKPKRGLKPTIGHFFEITFHL